MVKTKLVQTERPHLFTPNVYIALCVSISGNPGDERITQAISEAVENNESLCSKIVLCGNGSAYYEKIAAPNYQICFEDKNWIEIVKDFPLRSLNIWDGEMIRFYVLQSNGDLRLLIIGHHLAGDGLSFAYFAEDIIKSLNGERLSYKPLNILDVKNLPKETDMRLLKKLYLRRLNKEWLKNKVVFNTEDFRKLRNSYAASYDGSVFAHKLNELETDALIRQSKVIGVSVNNLLITAFLKAYEDKAAVGIPVSVREPNYRGMSNWVSGVQEHCQYDDALDFAANARAVQEKTYKLLNDRRRKYFVLHFLDLMEDTLLDSVSMVKYLGIANPVSVKLAKLMGYTEGLRDLGVTNLTRVTIKTDGEYTAKDMAFVPPVVPYCKRTIGVVTLGNMMSITMNTVMADKAAERELFKRAVNYLTQTPCPAAF